jgi:hypothetical protein
VTNDYASLFLLDYNFTGPCLVHNGMISGYGKGDMSDTQEFTEYYASGLRALSAAGNHNKIALLYPDCRIEYWSTLWIEDSGRKYSNAGYKPYSYPTYNSRDYYGSRKTRTYAATDMFGVDSAFDENGWPRKTETALGSPVLITGGQGMYVRKKGGFAPQWDENAALEWGLELLDDRTFVVMADGSYMTAWQISKAYDSTYYNSLRGAYVARDEKDAAWLLMDYKWPIPCGRVTSKHHKPDVKAVNRINALAVERSLQDEINQGVTLGEAAGAGLPRTFTNPAGSGTNVHTHTHTPTTTSTASGKLDKQYVPPGGAAAWRGFKVGDRVMVDDPTCLAKHLKTGVINELPTYTADSVSGGLNNRCLVSLDNNEGKYLTTKPSDLKLLSSQVQPQTPPVVVPPVTEAPQGSPEAVSELAALADTVLGDNGAPQHPVAE